MKFHEKIKQLRLERGLSQIELANKIGVAKSTYSLYESGKREPDVLKIKKIAAALNTTGDELLGTSIKNNELSKEAMSLAEKYDSLDDRGKSVVKALVNHEYEFLQTLKNKYKEEFACETNIIPMKRQIPLSHLPTSAGTGVYLDSSNYELIDIYDVPETKAANFAVRISGDSMEPEYFDGDIALVKQQPCVEDGEVGVFILNNEGYIKKCVTKNDKCYLVSLNPKYPPMEINSYDELKTAGKVIGVAKERF